MHVNLQGATVKVWVEVQSGTKDRINSWTLRAPKVAYEYSTLLEFPKTIRSLYDIYIYIYIIFYLLKGGL